jgi:exopolyphosphatase/guanosine-5'-triphosphate,3'-diphosphate pyrophosphatase
MSKWRTPERHAALDLGTNNCRLLIAAPQKDGFRIVDAFSRIVRLGEGLAASGALSEAAMARAIDALKVCAEKIERRGATRIRCIATQACRSASNGREFLDRAAAETGLKFEVITPEEEARLAVDGCADLIDPTARAALIFDIGGGSTELSWVRPAVAGKRRAEIIAWHSIPIGVVNLSERYGGRELSVESYAAIVLAIRDEIAAFGDPASLASHFASGGAHLLGTSGTVTSIAGVHLALPRYRRDAVDGLWLSDEEVRSVSDRLRAMSFDERAAEPCIGQDRADLVVCGCAILEAVLAEWPAARIRVADRGLREGVLAGLARGRRRRRRRKSPRAGSFDSKTHSL